MLVRELKTLGDTLVSAIIDKPNVIIPPPIAWGLAFIVGLGIDWLFPLRFVPAPIPRIWIGACLFLIGFAVAAWAITVIRTAGTRFETDKPTTAIVASGPYRITRNPIYIGMFLGQIGLAIGFDNLWLLATLVPFYFVIRYGVIAREELYLERKFGTDYLSYKQSVRRWI